MQWTQILTAVAESTMIPAAMATVRSLHFLARCSARYFLDLRRLASHLRLISSAFTRSAIVFRSK